MRHQEEPPSDDRTTMKKPADLFKPLRPLGDQWLGLWQGYRDHLEKLSGTELAELDWAVNSVSTTNIGWMHYEAAQMLRELIPDERRRRSGGAR